LSNLIVFAGNSIPELAKRVANQLRIELGKADVDRFSDGEVRVFGAYVRREAEVVVLNGFSAHADQQDLVAFARGVRERGALERIVLVHGEPAPQRALAEQFVTAGLPVAAIPRAGDRLEV